MLASAIASRRLVVTPIPDEPACTDGRTITVDDTATDADIRDAVVVQAALLAGGSLERPLMRRLARHRRTAADRYLALETARVAADLEHFLPTATVNRIRTTAATPVSSTSAESLSRALSREPIVDPPEWVGTLRPGRLARADAVDLRGSPTEADLGRLSELTEQPPELDDDDDESEESKILNLLSAPIANPLGDAIQKLLGLRRSGRSKSQGGGAEIPTAARRSGPVGPHARRGVLEHVLPSVYEPAPAFGTTYPEWDCNKATYRPDWCTVAEYDPAESDSERRLETVAAHLQRPLARVGVESERHRRQDDGGALDLSALVEYECDRVIGRNPDPYIYENTRHTKRDLSVLVLLDCSGSTAEESNGHVVFEEERTLAGELTAGLERLGDRVGTYGFYSRGRHAVKFLRIKEFDSRFDSAAKRRLMHVQPSGFTRIGAAIRHGSYVLESQALAKNMVLLVIGDGMPYDDGYEDRYARADARQAIAETMRRGIALAGLGIRSSTTPDILEEVWSDARVPGGRRRSRRRATSALVADQCAGHDAGQRSATGAVRRRRPPAPA